MDDASLVLFLFLLVIFVIIFFTFPLCAPVVIIFMNIFKKLVIFSSREDMVFSLLVALPFGFFTSGLFYGQIYIFSFLENFVSESLYGRLFNRGILNMGTMFLVLSPLLFIASFIFNYKFATKYNDKIYLKIISAIFRTQVSILCIVSLITFVIMADRYWYKTDRFEIIMVSVWGVGLIITALVAWACVKVETLDLKR